MVQPKIKAVVDASFWININKVNLVKYLLDYFELYFVSKVEDELESHKMKDFYNPKDLDVFRSLRELNLIKIKDPKVIDSKAKKELSKDSGELYTVSLAKEINAVVLIDDYGPYIFCDKNKISPLSTINFIVYLCELKIINLSNAEQLLFNLKGCIKYSFIEYALHKLKKVDL